MDWLICDSVYNEQQLKFSHLDSISHYLREMGESAGRVCLTPGIHPGTYLDWYKPEDVISADWADEGVDIAMVLDRFDWGAHVKAKIHVAQVAALTSPLPWEVRREDGSPAYDLVVSSLRWMVEAARAAGFRAEFQALAFDPRALMCGAGVQRDIPCLFVGTRDANHQKREAVLAELGDMVTIAPPTFGVAYYNLLARAFVTVHVGAEWSNGEANALRIFEGAGMGSEVVSDGEWMGARFRWWHEPTPNWRIAVAEAAAFPRNGQGEVLARHGYHVRLPQLVDWVNELVG